MMDTILMWAPAVLGTTAERWLGLTANVPVELLTRPPAAGEWSALDCLQHLVDTERLIFAARVRYLLAGEDFPSFDPDSQGTQPNVDLSPAALAQSFAAMRVESLALVATLTPADLQRRSRHSELGTVTLSEHLHEWAGHDLMHTVQAERALMQPFIDGCGPWQGYFADHVAA
ncbi:MAG: DinB family protein [Caldilineaceae bacterium]|nr:DinB family protein [Caldilineaceae bacterium]